MKDVYKNYKKYIEKSRKQTQFLKNNFSQSKMTELIKLYMDDINITVDVPIKLPTLKKINEEPVKLKLPTLKKTN